MSFTRTAGCELSDKHIALFCVVCFPVGALWMWETVQDKEYAQRDLSTVHLMAQHTQPVIFCTYKRWLQQVCQCLLSLLSCSYLLTPCSRALLEKLPGLAANQEIPRILWNLKVHCRTHKRPPPVYLTCDAASRNTPPRRSEWGSILPPDCFVPRGSISPMSIS